MNTTVTLDVCRGKVPSLTIVVPCYNEEAVFSYCLNKLSECIDDLIKKNKITDNSCILFIDDGSKDKTWSLITENISKNIRGIKLSRNRGHQIALLSGLHNVKTDISISIDADLQDDIDCIEKMIDCYQAGNEIVYGVRNDRTSDSFFKRFTANVFYSIMGKLGVEQVKNHADYRLLSRKALNALSEYNEQNLYLRGLIPLIGFKSDKVYYSRSERVAGESKYPLKKMLALAVEGITSLSVTPLRFISLLGFMTCIISLIMTLFVIFEKISGNTIEGWTSVMISIFFFGGVQLLSLGVIGEYIGKIFLETKRRPKYFIEDLNNDSRDEQKNEK